MAPTPREVVQQALRFEHPVRLPWHLCTLSIAEQTFPSELEVLRRRWPNDIECGCPAGVYRPSPRARGQREDIGVYVDEWGCEFTSLQKGVLGEVKNPVLADLSDHTSYRPPYEILPENPSVARDLVNRFCAASDKFLLAGCCPRPWERMQFLRGTVNAMMDIMAPEEGAAALLRKIHDFYLAEMEFWVSTDVDAVEFMDDWGSQRSLLISPRVWRDLFKPLYQDYCRLAHSRGKFVFMHSDGNISEIYEDLVEIGVDAINSQLFVMDMADLARRVKGKITFWGEIDRQHVMPSRDPEVVRQAVREVAKHLYDPAGGIIVQFELGPSANPANAFIIHEEWEAVHQEACPNKVS